MQRTAIILSILLVILSWPVFAMPFEVQLVEMYRTTGGGCCPSGNVFFRINKTFDKVVFSPVIAHHHNCGNVLRFMLFQGNTQIYSTSWEKCSTSESGVVYERDLGSAVAENFTYSGYLGSHSSGFTFLEARMAPYEIWGSVERNADPVSLGTISSLINVSPSSNLFRIYSGMPGVIAWIENAETDDWDYKRNETQKPDDELFVCADTNSNQVCDVNEGAYRDCDEKDGDWYNGYCCGINFTSCQFVGKIPYNTSYVCTKWGVRGCSGYQTVINNITINAICGKNMNGKWQWVPMAELGEIHEMSCPDGSVVSDGSAFFSCGGQLEGVTQPLGDFKTVSFGKVSHEYSCVDKVVYECGGRSGPFSSRNGIAMGRINPSLEDTYYCASDGDWTKDLDSKDEMSCTAAGYSWTGTYCCSEDDDINEYYNDPAYPNGLGGCWNKIFIPTGDFVPYLPIGADRVINYKGRFFGCRIPASSPILQLKDVFRQPPHNLLVNNSVTPCGAVLTNIHESTKPHAVCQPDGKWEFTSELAGMINKSIKWPVRAGMKGISVTGCCAYDQCWNGTACQQLNSYYRIGEEGFVCKMPKENVIVTGPSPKTD
ncbi:MAG: hypothetical protein QXT19_00825 [Candidatus Woesearchaeota archaeon]